MNSQEILKFCFEKGVLLDKEVLVLLNEIKNKKNIEKTIEEILKKTNQKIINKSIFEKYHFKQELKKDNKIEEIDKKLETEEFPKKEDEIIFNILENSQIGGKKLGVEDFVNYFRERFNSIRKILQEKEELENLVSINKISGSKQGMSIIGMVSDKKITKNKNIIFEIEDLTGKVKILINKDKKDLYKFAEMVSLDSVLGFKGSGNKEIIFVNEIIFPEANLSERRKSPIEENILFVGDLHIGSKLFMEENLLKFIDYINGKSEEAKKIKYIFIVGDLVAGIGNYPGQENELESLDLKIHFKKAAELLGGIRKDIQIIISPGNHDGVRLMEPQPAFYKEFLKDFKNLKNINFINNPCQFDFGKHEGFDGFNILMYHGFSYFYYVGNIPHLVQCDAANKPEEIMKYILKNRHLAPAHASTQYYPSEKDNLVISDVPDIFVSGHTHKSAVSYCNNILIVSVSSWEKITEYQKKRGACPDFCKVPMFNLKTREVKILDFE